MERLARRMQPDEHRAIENAIAGLAGDPRPPGVLKLESEADAFRCRVGQYRILYHVSDDERLVVIARVARRGESTYRRRL